MSQNQRKSEVVQVFGEQKKKMQINENRAEVQYVQPNVEQKNLESYERGSDESLYTVTKS